MNIECILIAASTCVFCTKKECNPKSFWQVIFEQILRKCSAAFLTSLCLENQCSKLLLFPGFETGSCIYCLHSKPSQTFPVFICQLQETGALAEGKKKGRGLRIEDVGTSSRVYEISVTEKPTTIDVVDSLVDDVHHPPWPS